VDSVNPELLEELHKLKMLVAVSVVRKKGITVPFELSDRLEAGLSVKEMVEFVEKELEEQEIVAPTSPRQNTGSIGFGTDRHAGSEQGKVAPIPVTDIPPITPSHKSKQTINEREGKNAKSPTESTSSVASKDNLIRKKTGQNIRPGRIYIVFLILIPIIIGMVAMAIYFWPDVIDLFTNWVGH